MSRTAPGTLNEQQERIVAHLEGPALVIAGAGSGKTRVITHRVARLIEVGVPPGAILMMTFTNKAAEEMRLRVDALLGGAQGSKGLIAGTFHSVANRFLRRYGNLIGYERNYSILDETDARELIKAASSECVGKNSERKFPTAAVVQNVLSMAFNRNLELGALLQREYPWLEEFVGELEAIQALYRRKKKSNNSMDFDDLLDNWHALLSTHTELELTNRVRYLMVDEYQDTNYIQAELLALLARKHGNLMVVGDDAQSIYGWRGANFENILHFPDRFGGEVYRLEQNYRSTPDILELANASINHNTAQFTKHLQAVKPHLELPQLTHVRDEYEESDYVVERLLYYRDRDIPLNEMGVLYRSHNQSAALQMRLTQAGIPFMVRSGVKFFEQAHVKDVVAFLKVIFNPLDEIAWLRILKLLPGIGNTTAQRIYRIFAEQRAVRLASDNEALKKAIPAKAREAWAELAATFKQLLEDGVSPSEMILRVTRGFYHATLYSQFDNAREREADLSYLAEFAGQYGTVERFLSQLALVGGTVIRDYEEEQEEDPEFLTLTSIHQAKGLEWDVVFLIGLADGRFPHARCLEPLERLEEERRLFYVAATRCRRHLELTVPLVNYQNGRPEICRPSRFVEELPEGVVIVNRMESVEGLRPYLAQGPRMSVDW
ncbi:MAG TPA: ATP-dependent helicase [bacterium]|jgi:DNA helicase-2/ATP-dependent DNA helicase PcrA